MARKLARGPRNILIAAAVGVGLYFGVPAAMERGIIPSYGFLKSKTIETNANLQAAKDVAVANVTKAGLPTTEPAEVGGPQLRAEFWAWNAQMGCLYAIGGKQTTKGSLFEKYGVNAVVSRQDDTPTMANDLLTYAKAYSEGDKNPSEGVNMVAVMGSQGFNFIRDMNARLKPYGDGMHFRFVCGRSDGEDAIMGPPAWKANPKAMKGGVIAVVPTEGDAHIIIKFAKDNGLKYNPDPTTYDPDAVNIMAAGTFTEAAEKYISQATEPRTVVKDGRKTGETKEVSADGVSTWTPADVNAAQGRGGIVRIVSTHEYSGLMPNGVATLDRWSEDNHETLVNVFRAFGEGSAQVLAHPDALQRACEISAQVYEAETPAYWCKYYRGVTEKDKTGKSVQLGGSRAATLADNEVWFGLKPGQTSLFAAAYTFGGKSFVELYPDQIDKYDISAEQAFDTKALRDAIAAAGTDLGGAETQEYAATGQTVSRRSWNILFKTGSAELTPAAERQLEEILNDVALARELAVEVQGHTDNTGTVEGNNALSEARAFAIKTWLEERAPSDFPEGRIRAAGFGQSQPVAPNGTAAGKAKNRRVDILLRGN